MFIGVSAKVVDFFGFWDDVMVFLIFNSCLFCCLVFLDIAFCLLFAFVGSTVSIYMSSILLGNGRVMPGGILVVKSIMVWFGDTFGYGGDCEIFGGLKAFESTVK